MSSCGRRPLQLFGFFAFGGLPSDKKVMIEMAAVKESNL
jgi:hypothetical protein